jgi:translocation protein SEC63
MTEYNYDDGQFYPIFILVLAAILTLPATYSAIIPSKDLENTAPRIRSDYKPDHADMVEGLKKKQKRKERKVKRLLFSAFGWGVMAWMIWLILVTARTTPQIWDPYSVLGVSRSTSEKDIKSHYKELAKTQHPDKAKLDTSKNQTMDDINEHWVEITKAFKALT